MNKHAWSAQRISHCTRNSRIDQKSNLAPTWPPKVLRANRFTECELDLRFKINPAKILGIAAPDGTR